MHFLDINTGMVELDNGQMLRTSDMGNTWRLLQKREYALNHSRQIDFGTMLAVGDKGLALMSYDGATAWKKLAYPTSLNLNAINMKSWGKSVIVGDSGLILAGNAGYDSLGKMPFPSKENLSYVIFYDESIGVLASSEMIFHTRNAGESWNSVKPALQKGSYHFSASSLSFIDTNTAFLATYDSIHSYAHVYRTGDGGHNWRSVFSDSTGTHPGFSSIAFKNSSCGVIGGKENKGIYTIDGGRTWSGFPAYLVDFNNNSGALIYSSDKLEIKIVEEDICPEWIGTLPNSRSDRRLLAKFESGDILIDFGLYKSTRADLRLYDLNGELIVENLKASVRPDFSWKLSSCPKINSASRFLLVISMESGEIQRRVLVKPP
jgi:photosystem II stability/assembly factor-like uncharacterized protein